MKNKTIELYYKKVKPIQDIIVRLYQTNPALTDDVVSPVIDELKRKFDYPEFEINVIRFIDPKESLNEEEWELSVDQNIKYHFSLN
jgi:hypothetical protein